ncbi:MAG TPA: alpha/beta hydrolase [Cyanobacteria bacterium UBA8803]|nr:alpha/beta hydrolase [Cyanobacteria bacterium UBA9273]HBL62916.1 alpha/beta hydrolase [Cyanobacteria bacterium UBA8803]
MTLLYLRILILSLTTLYQIVACWREDRSQPPGQWADVGGYRLHYVTAGTGAVTIVLDHSLGGIEGYFLLDELAKLSRVCIYDRAGFGWSDRSPHARTSQQIVTELDNLLHKAGIEPPYLLVGDSFGSYNMRLYAHRFPEKVVGLVLTDGLHESGMLQMSLALKGLQLFFVSGFVMSILGSSLGLIRVLCRLGVFELLKSELRQFSPSSLRAVKRSFCRPKHWLTMTQEILDLSSSARQVRCVSDLQDLPIVSIKSHSFFKPSWMTALMPLKEADQLRDQMHDELLTLSRDCIQLDAEKSGHFVWVDQPEVIIKAVQLLLSR